MESSIDNAKYLAASLTSMSEGLFIIHSRNDQPSLPMVAFSFNPEKNLKFNETTFVHWLREQSWIIPAYTLAANADDITVCRIVVRETFTRNIALILLEDIRLVLISLADHHGHQDLVESLKAARNDTHQHRRSNRHGRRVANFIQSNHETSTNHHDSEQAKKNGKGKQNVYHTMHVIC
jgi:glutamate decarboxylase